MDIDTIGIGMIIKNNKTGKYLLVEERNTNKKTNKFAGDFSIVVGHIKKNESLIDSALREIKEELGSDFGLKIDHFLGIVHYLKGEIVVMFLSETDKENLGRGSWFSIDEIRNLDNLRPTNIDIIEQFHQGKLKGLNSIFTI